MSKDLQLKAFFGELNTFVGISRTRAICSGGGSK